MSLADRLDSARRSAQPTEPTSPTGARTAGGRRRAVDPFAEVKGRVHQALIDSLGPRLYDPHLPEAELAAQVRQTLQETIDAEQTPLSHADRTRIAQEVSDEILGHGPLEPLLRDPEITEIMVNGADYDLRRARRQDLPGRRAASATRRTCAASSTRSSAGSAAASTRRARWSTPACPTAPASTP